MAARQAAELWLCHRPFGDESDAVRMVNEARVAIVRDTAERALTAGVGAVRVFSTTAIAGLEVERTTPDQTIGDIVSAAASDTDGPVCYAGSGMPALTSDDWARVLATLETGKAVSNRMFSCDWIGVPHGRILEIVQGEQLDNRFALLVRDDGSVPVDQFERSARSLLDLDTPTDLAVLAVCAEFGSLQIGSSLAAVLETWKPLLAPTLARVVDVFEIMTMRQAELMIAGRVSGADWAAVDRDTSCRVRVLSEERGLRARGERARSLLATAYQSLGCEQFVSLLLEMSDSMIWDTRPFFSHLGWNPSYSERFWADLGRWDEIADGPLRELIAALSPHRVLTGGHSLVAGGLLAAIDEAWSRRELSG